MTDPKQDIPQDDADDIEVVADLEAPAETQQDIAGGVSLHAAAPTAAVVD